MFDTIIGYDDVELFLMSLKAEKPVHILLVGPPASTKTAMLLEIPRLKDAFGAEEAIKEYLGFTNIIYRNQLVVGELASNWKDRFEKGLEKGLPGKTRLLNIRETELGYLVEIEFTPQDPEIMVGSVKSIEIITFKRVLEDLETRFGGKGFTRKDFPDSTRRAIQ